MSSKSSVHSDRLTRKLPKLNPPQSWASTKSTGACSTSTYGESTGMCSGLWYDRSLLKGALVSAVGSALNLKCLRKSDSLTLAISVGLLLCASHSLILSCELSETDSQPVLGCVAGKCCNDLVAGSTTGSALLSVEYLARLRGINGA
ncbi:hypothetical protein OGATHE_001709 [Ogataea polymorpha]|uniref:Uncharacterized protein n=1 Tax=Ogataea polymorpha TaxID=460523 RepID=A0A9P8PPV8_9ASCO|nr:hypothetical protein OGATHE_001709 [Ogataea polymorpha]